MEVAEKINDVKPVTYKSRLLNSNMELMQQQYTLVPKKIYTPRNIISLKKMIFPTIAEEKISQLMIDDESIKYITFNTSAQQISNIIMNSLSDFPCPTTTSNSSSVTNWNSQSLSKKMKKLVITEMTAGVGGNVLNFAKYFKYVNAIEIDPLRYNYLDKNIKLYEYDNVNCYNDDSINLLIKHDDIVQDIIFFDPPWGGKDYKLYYKLRLKFVNYAIEEICHILFQRDRNKMIIMKLPNNYDFEYMCDTFKDYRVSKFVLDRMTIIVVKKYPTN